MHRLFKAALAAAALTLSAIAPAQTLRPLIGLGLTTGGETLAGIEYDDGSTEKVRSGSLVQLMAGVHVDLAPGVAVQATLGYHEDSARASNLRVTFARVPLEVIGQYELFDRYWIGLGLRRSYATRYWARGSATYGSGVVRDASFDSDLGLIVEGEYRITDGFGMSLRMVREQFSFPSGHKLDGNHVGIYGKLMF